MTPHVRGCPLFTHPSQRGPGHPTVCTCPSPTPGSDWQRVVHFLREHPGATVMDIRLGLWISREDAA